MTIMRYDDDHGVRIERTALPGCYAVHLHTRPVCGPSLSEDGEDWPSEIIGTVRKERERGRRGGWRDVWRPIHASGSRYATRRTRPLAAAVLARTQIERTSRARRAGKLDRDK